MVCIEKSNAKKLNSIIISLPDMIKINDLVDTDGFTILHMAVFKNKTDLANLMMKKAK